MAKKKDGPVLGAEVDSEPPPPDPITRSPDSQKGAPGEGDDFARALKDAERRSLKEQKQEERALRRAINKAAEDQNNVPPPLPPLTAVQQAEQDVRIAKEKLAKALENALPISAEEKKGLYDVMKSAKNDLTQVQFEAAYNEYEASRSKSAIRSAEAAAVELNSAESALDIAKNPPPPLPPNPPPSPLQIAEKELKTAAEVLRVAETSFNWAKEEVKKPFASAVDVSTRIEAYKQADFNLDRAEQRFVKAKDVVDNLRSQENRVRPSADGRNDVAAVSSALERPGRSPVSPDNNRIDPASNVVAMRQSAQLKDAYKESNAEQAQNVNRNANIDDDGPIMPGPGGRV